MSGHGATAGRVIHSARAYDALAWVISLGREKRFRTHLIGLARLATGESVLDVGCGTGTLAIEAKRRVGAGGEVAGVDPSPEMTARARRKAAKAGIDVDFQTAAVETLPFADARFEVVLGTLMLHHLTEDGRRSGVAEISRVLRPGGRFLAVDLGGDGSHSRHGLINRFPEHASFDLESQVPLLESAGLEIVDRGPVGGPRLLGLSGLRYLYAVRPSG